MTSRFSSWLMGIALFLVPLFGAGQTDTATILQLQAKAYPLLGNNNEEAIRQYQATIRLSESIGFEKGIAIAKRKIGYACGQLGQYREAIDHLRYALEYYRKMQQPVDMAYMCNNIAADYQELGKPDSAMLTYLKGIELLEDFDPGKDRAMQLNWLGAKSLLYENVGNNFTEAKDFNKAIQYLEKARQTSLESRDTARMITSLCALSHLYESLRQDFRQSLNLAKRAVFLANLMDDHLLQAKSYHMESVSYNGLNLLDSAAGSGQLALTHAKVSNLQLYITACLDLSDVYEKQQQWVAEAAILEEARNQLEEVNNVRFGYNLYERLASASSHLGKYREAYDYHVKAIDFRDSSHSLERDQRVQELEIQYQTARKDLKIQEGRILISYVSAGLILALVLVIFFFLRNRYLQQAHYRELVNLRQARELQIMEALMQGEEKERARIARDLHDGVAGLLSAVKMHFSSIRDGESDIRHTRGYQSGMQLLNEAASEVRKTSHNLMPEVLLRHGLDEALKRFCMSLENPPAFTVQYDSWGAFTRFAPGIELAIYRIVQELLNNVLKHSKASQAAVQCSQQGSLLTISIEDNGVGFSSASTDLQGTGLANLQDRVKSLQGRMDVDTASTTGLSVYLEFEIEALQQAE